MIAGGIGGVRRAEEDGMRARPRAAAMDASHRRRRGVARTLAVDRYLETIYCIAGEGEPTRPSRIAHWLEVSAPTVSTGLRRLRAGGWVRTKLDHQVVLTPAGRAVAEGVVRRHRVVERWLTDVLGMDWASAHTEAKRLAPATSAEVLERLDRVLGHPATCPHGQPIPGRPRPYGELIALADLPPGMRAQVRRISEIIEHESFQLLSELGTAGVRTDTEVTVQPDGDNVLLSLDGGRAPLWLPLAAARLIWVEAAGTRR
jgi:DtxR family Mn-dependent transcriptional regulator